MTGLRKLERDFAKADLATVTSLIDQLTDDDVMARMGLESRRDQLVTSISHFDEEKAESIASAALFFGGRPVAGSRGIESNFGAGAVAKFQDLVAKVHAQETTGLGQRGIVPNKGAATLHITNVVRGSFGFLLEEIEPQGQIVDTALKSAVDDASRLLDAFGEADEEAFRSAVESTDQRVLTTAREFFDHIRSYGATMRLVAGDMDRSFGLDAVVRAADRAMSTVVEETTESITGQLSGVLPEARQFEFKTTTSTIRGKIDREMPADALTSLNRELVGVDATAWMRIKKVRRNGDVVRESHVLLDLKRVDV